MRCEIGEDDAQALIEYRYVMGWEHESWRPRVEVATRVNITAEAFNLEAQLNAFDGKEEVYTKTWQRTVPRSLG